MLALAAYVGRNENLVLVSCGGVGVDADSTVPSRVISGPLVHVSVKNPGTATRHGPTTLIAKRFLDCRFDDPRFFTDPDARGSVLWDIKGGALG